jgi:hypothetical protein
MLVRFSTFLALTLAAPLAAQAPTSTPSPAPRTEDVSTIEGIIAALYASISGPKDVERDWDRLRTLFVPDARMMPTGRRQNGERVRLVWDIEEYIKAAGPGLKQNGFYEREISSRVDRFGQVAHVFSTYESRFTPEDPKPFQRGINSIQLWNDGSRWWILSVFWQGESEAAPIPAEYLPK